VTDPSKLRMIDLILPASESTLPGDFVVRRALPRRELRRVGGFVFLDHFDERDVTPEKFDVPPHPHIGLQTVTYLFDGEILHTDSLDYVQPIRPGDVNWMTSGRGITHAEQVTEKVGRLHGVQAWVGLPHKDRKTEPKFEHFSNLDLPKTIGENFDISVVAGLCEDQRSPIPTFQELVYLSISVSPGSEYRINVEKTHELAVYVCEGAVNVGGTELKRFDLGRLTKGNVFSFSANEEARFMLFGGEPLPEPTVIYWNFITDTIGEAKRRLIDWEEGKFPPVLNYQKISSIGDEGLEERILLM
jgi:quercetin 2,3-dioxygenase